PTTRSLGWSPPWKMSTWGMLVMPYLTAVSWLASVFSLPTLTLPANWSAMRSMVGPSIRHGPHQGAQKSTSTGTSLLVTSCSQLVVVISLTFGLAMIVSSFARRFGPGSHAAGAAPIVEHCKRGSACPQRGRRPADWAGLAVLAFRSWMQARGRWIQGRGRT